MLAGLAEEISVFPTTFPLEIVDVPNAYVAGSSSYFVVSFASFAAWAYAPPIAPTVYVLIPSYPSTGNSLTSSTSKP